MRPHAVDADNDASRAAAQTEVRTASLSTPMAVMEAPVLTRHLTLQFSAATCCAQTAHSSHAFAVRLMEARGPPSANRRRRAPIASASWATSRAQAVLPRLHAHKLAAGRTCAQPPHLRLAGGMAPLGPLR
jgi:hypothetical protein